MSLREDADGNIGKKSNSDDGSRIANALANLDGNMKVCVAYPDTACGLDEFEYETFDVRAKGVTTSIAGQDEPVFRLEAWSISS